VLNTSTRTFYRVAGLDIRVEVVGEANSSANVIAASAGMRGSTPPEKHTVLTATAAELNFLDPEGVHRAALPV